MQAKHLWLTLLASGLLLSATPSLAIASELRFGDVPIGTSKVLRLYGGLGLSTGSAGGGSCARGMVTTRIVISGENAKEFQDIGGSYVGLHVPGNRYFEDIRFTPHSVGEKQASFLPESTPVSATCGLKTNPSSLSGKATPQKHKSIFARLLQRHKAKHKNDYGPQALVAPGEARPDLPHSIGVMAGLSRNVYSGNSTMYGYHFIGDSCTLLHYNCNAVGFIANAYESNNDAEIIIAIRGSAATESSLRDGLFAPASDSSLFILGPKMRDAFVSDVQAGAEFVRFIAARYSRATIKLTGHSLGGAIAQFLGAAAGDSAYAFDAPGTKLLFTRLAIPLGKFPTPHTNNYQNVNLRILGDQVSLAGVPMGRVITIQNPPALALMANQNALACTAVRPILTQLHSMDTMIRQINHDVPSVEGSQEPHFLPTLSVNMWCEDPSSLF